MPAHILNKRQKRINCVSPPQKFLNFLTLHFRATVPRFCWWRMQWLSQRQCERSRLHWFPFWFLIPCRLNWERHWGFSCQQAELLMKLFSLHLATPVLPSSTGHRNSFLLWQGLEAGERHKSETLCKLDLPFRVLFVFGMSQQMLVWDKQVHWILLGRKGESVRNPKELLPGWL